MFSRLSLNEFSESRVLAYQHLALGPGGALGGHARRRGSLGGALAEQGTPVSLLRHKWFMRWARPLGVFLRTYMNAGRAEEDHILLVLEEIRGLRNELAELKVRSHDIDPLGSGPQR